MWKTKLKALCSGVLLTASLGAGGSARASPARWTVNTEKSRITINVFKKGLFSALAHDHHFVPSKWHATARFDGASPSGAHVEVIVAANSLQDQQPALSQKDREKVNGQAAGPEVLDAHRYSEIRFVSHALEVAPRTSVDPDAGVQGTLKGMLSLHGKERSVSVPVIALKEGNAWHARGAVTFKQSDFGIRPYSGFAGTVAVRDEVKLEYDVLLVPAS